jgi:putative tryptophan/tyrosine transport system substrate-binding protein
MRRREFIALVGGTVTWPLAARGQQGEGVRRVGVLLAAATDDPEYQARFAAFTQALAQLGWRDGQNLRIGTLGHS